MVLGELVLGEVPPVVPGTFALTVSLDTVTTVTSVLSTSFKMVFISADDSSFVLKDWALAWDTSIGAKKVMAPVACRLVADCCDWREDAAFARIVTL